MKSEENEKEPDLINDVKVESLSEVGDDDSSVDEQELTNHLEAIDPESETATFAAFLGSNISTQLKKKALQKLFSAKHFNVLDGLDDYALDYSRPEKLGDILTNDRAFQVVQEVTDKIKQQEKALASLDLDSKDIGSSESEIKANEDDYDS